MCRNLVFNLQVECCLLGTVPGTIEADMVLF
jgi:hypothetical protein